MYKTYSTTELQKRAIQLAVDNDYEIEFFIDDGTEGRLETGSGFWELIPKSRTMYWLRLMPRGGQYFKPPGRPPVYPDSVPDMTI